MPYVITQACATSKDTSCVDVCPVDAIHPGPNDPAHSDHDQLYIDPVDCIDCGACEPACPVEAIYHDADVPDDQRDAIAVNRDFFRRSDS